MKYFFVSDFFSSEVQGGAELTFESIGKVKMGEVQFVKSEQIVPQAWQMPDVHWVLGNYTRIHPEAINALCELSKRGLVKYSIIEFDYKYCKVRNELVHNKVAFDRGLFEFCNCANEPLGKITEVLFNNAQTVHFMSRGQMDLVKKKLSGVHGKNFRVQWSTWDDDHLDKLEGYYQEAKRTVSNGKWAIQKSDNWLKGQEQAVAYAEANNLDYEVIPPMKYDDFIKYLSQFKGFIFHPNAWDTCPRIVVEAYLMGLQIRINDKVQIIDDAIFEQDRDNLMTYLRSNKKTFWDNV